MNATKRLRDPKPIPNSNKRVRRMCTHIDASNIKCITPLVYIKGGIKGKCKAHGGIPRCEHFDSSNVPCRSFQYYMKGGIKGYCKAHGGYPLCTHFDASNVQCRKSQNYLKGGIRGYCGVHGGIPICGHLDSSGVQCTTVQVYLKGGIKGFCGVHGGYPKCEHLDASGVQCHTPQKYLKGGMKGFCKTHGGGPLCVHLDANNVRCSTPQQHAKGGIKGFCVVHGGYPRCVGCQLFSVHKSGGMCSYCNPESKTALRQKEMRVRRVIQDAFPDLQVVYDKRCAVAPDNACAIGPKYRPDVLLQTCWGYVVVEIDEHQHAHYDASCERERMAQIALMLGLPVVYIRYNPDAFKVGGKTRRVPSAQRHVRLVSTMQHVLSTEFVPGAMMQCIYLYYSCDGQCGCNFVDAVGSGGECGEVHHGFRVL